jgi:hypothetical protein
MKTIFLALALALTFAATPSVASEFPPIPPGAFGH